MKTENGSKISRRRFLESSVKATAISTIAFSGFPTIVPASVLGKNSPGNRINVGAIGTGRISRIHDLPGVWKSDMSQIMAVCDLDTKRGKDGKVLVNGYYSNKTA